MDAVLLTVSELVTNVHRHTHSSAQSVMICDDHYLRTCVPAYLRTCVPAYLRTCVHDKSGDLPVPRAAGTESRGGRGMPLVDAVADTWERS
ncbi:ATP-binding protein [Streptomyces sp. NPDC058470]|uniref:ATP-binding protein n=1 Tax=Streptomyces sp. NPDC058470 TaxID=3346515 RepID=UPI0036578669